MEVRECVKQLVGPEHHPAYRKWSSSCLKPFREIVARDMLHHEILLPVFGEMVAHFRQYRMPQTCQDLGLALESCSELLVVGEARSLQRHGTAQPLVDRQ